MSKMRKVLFSALAVFAMFTIGALNLSASNVTSEVTESKVEMSAEVTQTPYTGEVYYWKGSALVLVPGVDISNCSLDLGEDSFMIYVFDDNNLPISVRAHGLDSIGQAQPLFLID